MLGVALWYRTAFVMPGLVPGIHALRCLATKKDVDGRDKPGHDKSLRWDQFACAAGLSLTDSPQPQAEV